MNLWFRVRVEEALDPGQRASLLKDLERRASLDKKLRNWPLRYLGVPIDLESGIGGEFIALKELRNSIVHFTTTHETIRFDNVKFDGLASTTTTYDNLGATQAAGALSAAENMVAAVVEAAGVPLERIPHVFMRGTVTTQ